MVLLVSIAAAIVILTIGTVLATHLTLRRRNQVVAGVASPAPLSWLTSHRREPRLHRRLRLNAQRLESLPQTTDVADIIARLRVELVELDSYLVTVAKRPSSARRADRGPVQERLEEIEAIVRRLEERSHTHPVSLDELSERLDLLDAADAELDALDPGSRPGKGTGPTPS